ncbi:MAG: stage II sporulation protein D [Thermoclostridium sp.]|nr:stage II sporulation protein D [Thermoclostridium sp.]
MRENRKLILLVACLLVFFLLTRFFQKKEEKPPEPEVTVTVIPPEPEIMVYNTRDDMLQGMMLNDYLVGVVAAEMEAWFSMEALKAQAIAARTYALGRAVGKYGSYMERHFGAHVCTDSTHCQAWIPREMYSTWYPKADEEENWARIEQAVHETSGLILTYEGEIINPMYHANSGGITEDVEEVWNSVKPVPYLQSVYSEGENNYSSFEKNVILSGEKVREVLMKEYSDIVFLGPISEDVQVVRFTGSDRVKEIRIGSITIPGTKFRELFSLSSTQMKIQFIKDDEMGIMTYGFGHGVGMSQCGANALAEKGKDCTYILQYYYTGVEIVPITEEILSSLKTNK